MLGAPLLAAKVQVPHGSVHQLTDRLPQLLRRGATDEVPAIEYAVDRQVGKQGERERNGQRAVDLVSRLSDAELVGEP